GHGVKKIAPGPDGQLVLTPNVGAQPLRGAFLPAVHTGYLVLLLDLAQPFDPQRQLFMTVSWSPDGTPVGALYHLGPAGNYAHRRASGGRSRGAFRTTSNALYWQAY